MHHGDNKITEAFNPTSVLNNNYGAIIADSNPRDDAYDRYVSNPYE